MFSALKKEDGKTLPNEVGWLQNDSFASAFRTDDAGYFALLLLLSVHWILSKILPDCRLYIQIVNFCSSENVIYL